MQKIIAKVIRTYEVKFNGQWITKAVLDTKVPAILVKVNGEKTEAETNEIIGYDIYWNQLKKGDSIRIELRRENNKIIKRCYKM